ncbi:MAG: hypothetical protein IPL39_25695 [Opitutaceae bacterium]|nr:hypothetical protein [Opitutaceae bacterium]
MDYSTSLPELNESVWLELKDGTGVNAVWYDRRLWWSYRGEIAQSEVLRWRRGHAAQICERTK